MNVATRTMLCAAASLLAAAQANATIINFEEFAPDNTNGTIESTRYDYLGVTFQGTDDSTTWAGLAGGDPGNWGVDGTNGATFAGFNGDSYGLILLFASDILNFGLDASRTNGSSDGTITIEAFLDGISQGTDIAVLGGINEWSTLSLLGTFDEVRITGTGNSFHPFGIDNLAFNETAVPEPSTWAMMLLGFGAAGFALRRRGKAPIPQAA